MAESTYHLRRERALTLLEAQKTEAAAFSHLPNIRYLTGFTGSNAVVVLSEKDTILYTDPRYELQAAQETDCKVRVVRGALWPEVAKTAKRRRFKALGLETEQLAQAECARIGERLGTGARLNDMSGLVERLRAVKDAGEIAAIRRSMEVCGRAYLQTSTKIRVGMSEAGLAAELEYRMRRLGAERPSFETIVAAGPRSALPHAQPTRSRIEPNQLVLVDMGACLDGYASDMTRMSHTGRPNAQTRRLYAAVLEAQLAALDAVRPGAKCSSIDGTARKTLQRHGLGEFFVHSTGHGLGLEIHESPRIGRRAKDKLEQNMVITIEPGAYIPGKGGVRIEDTVLVTARGAEVLTTVPKELLVL